MKKFLSLLVTFILVVSLELVLIGAKYTVSNVNIYENDKKYLTIAFDITRKEAGSFMNMASVDDLQILGGGKGE